METKVNSLLWAMVLHAAHDYTKSTPWNLDQGDLPHGTGGLLQMNKDFWRCGSE
jgi:hypothetical protein